MITIKLIAHVLESEKEREIIFINEECKDAFIQGLEFAGWNEGSEFDIEIISQ